MGVAFCWSPCSLTVTHFRPLTQTYPFTYDQYNTTSVAEFRIYFTPAYILQWTNRSRNALSSPLRQGCTRQHYVMGRSRVNITAFQSKPVTTMAPPPPPRRRAVHHSVLSCIRAAWRCILYISSIKYTSVNSSK